jgi:signal transduction histidine kinase
LLSSDDSDVVSVLVSRVLALSEADVVWLLQPTADSACFTIEIARGLDADNVQGTVFPAPDSAVAQPGLIGNGSELGMTLSDGSSLGPAMLLPLSGSGTLVVGRMPGALRFTQVELELASDFADRASLAIELAAARVGRQRLALIEDRARIARDLHDHVIQQLFATGLELQSVAGAAPADLARRIAQAVINMDASISQIRTVIFALSVPTSDARDNVRHSIIDLANELAPRLADTPTVTFSGPVDLVIDKDLADDVVAVTREALLNVIKHAGAEHTSIDLAVIDGEVRLQVTDDGRGASGSTRRSGVANLEQRALVRSGRFAFNSGDEGTRVSWIVPFESLPRAEQP